MKKQIFTGFLFDKNWETAMRTLKPKQFFQLFWELYDYQMSKGRIKIPPHPDNQIMDMIASFIEPQITNRLYGARVFADNTETPNTPYITPHPTQGGDTGGSIGGTVGGDAPKLS